MNTTTLITVAVIATVIQYIILSILIYTRLSTNATVKDFFKEWSWQIEHGNKLIIIAMTPAIGLIFYTGYCLVTFIRYLYDKIINKRIK